MENTNSQALSTDVRPLSFKKQIALETGFKGRELTTEWHKRCKGHAAAVAAYIEAKKQEGYLFDAPKELKSGDVSFKMFRPRQPKEKGLTKTEIIELIQKNPKMTAAEITQLLNC